MSAPVMVAYATKAGSTAEVADAIAQVLSGRGFQVQVQRIVDKPQLVGCQAVVIGSAIRMGAWLPEAVEFVRANQVLLSRLPVALFTVHLLNTGDDEASRAARQAYTAPVRRLVTPQAEAFFSGKMDYSKLSFVDGAIARAVERAGQVRPGDFRDWSKIRTWALGILG